MNDAPRHPDDFDTLLSAAAEGALTPERHEALMAHLAARPDERDRYVDYVMVHAHLHWEGARATDPALRGEAPLPSTSLRAGSIGVNEPSASPHADAEPAPGRSVWYAKGFRVQGSGVIFKAAIAALLVVAAALIYFFLPSTPHSPLPTPRFALPPSYAMLSDVSADARFENADTFPSLGSDLAGPIMLTTGRAQVMFKSTAVVDLIGPCEFEMTGPNRGHLIAGRIQAAVRPEAHGFAVDLPGGARVIDLGTRFDLAVNAVGAGQLRVLEGKVELRAPGDVSAGILLAGQAARFDAAGRFQVNLVRNGSFESARLPTPSRFGGVWDLKLANGGAPNDADNTLAHWTLTGSGNWLFGPTFWKAADGDDALSLNNFPNQHMIAEQTLAVVSGERYTLRFDLTGRFDAPRSPPVQSIRVQVIDDQGTLMDQTFEVHQPEHFDRLNEPGWQPQSLSFTARSEHVTLRFETAANSHPYGVVIDDVELHAASDKAADDTRSNLNRQTPSPAHASEIGETQP
ncbi:MAG: DUF642 domain-containing protein [Planctomycetes bacterium]|nr:DUF642 domain-containing protein [Planctomycetota bacterium]